MKTKDLLKPIDLSSLTEKQLVTRRNDLFDFAQVLDELIGAVITEQQRRDHAHHQPPQFTYRRIPCAHTD